MINKKLIFWIMSIFYIFLNIFFTFYYNYGILFIGIALYIILYLSLLKLKFNITIFNKEHKENNKLVKNIRSKISKNECYMENLEFKTFDGSGSVTHPSVLYFKDGFNGYKYWMALTPYNNNSIDLEIPCIYVSNDGKKFSELLNCKNPLLEYIPKQIPSKYYSDPFLFFDNNHLELWYRLSIEDKKNNLLKDYIYYMESKDGNNWSKPKLIIDDNENYLSISIVKKNNKYYMYYFDVNGNLFVKESTDKKEWKNKKKITIEGLKANLWHGEVRIIDGKIQTLLMTKDFKLYNAVSKDFYNFDNTKKINLIPYNEHVYGKYHLYKSSFFLDNDYIYIYVPFKFEVPNFFSIKRFTSLRWILTYSKIAINNKKILIKEVKDGKQ